MTWHRMPSLVEMMELAFPVRETYVPGDLKEPDDPVTPTKDTATWHWDPSVKRWRRKEKAA